MRRSDSVRAVSDSLTRVYVALASAAALTACGGQQVSSQQLGYDTGVAPGSEGLSLLEGLLLYLLAPAAILFVVAALVWLPGMLRGTGYRPGRAWSAAPLWFGGPPDPTAAVEAATPGSMARGGASGSW